MPSSEVYDNVVPITAARFRRNSKAETGSARSTPAPRTVIIQASNIQSHREAHRQIGVEDSMTLMEFRNVLDTTFSLPASRQQPPWAFIKGGRINSQLLVRDLLQQRGDELSYNWGLWSFELDFVESYPRDDNTPRALCIGGSGDLWGGQFDEKKINEALVGEEVRKTVLLTVRAEVRDLVSRTALFEFVPFLQALDLNREAVVDPDVASACATLPREHSLIATDAFWACVIGFSCFGSTEVFDEVIVTTMTALDWKNNTDGDLKPVEIRHLCENSLEVLTQIGATGEHQLPPVERLEIYRELLRA